MLTNELVKSIYPLNKLSEAALHRLSENARKQHLRANRQLFKIGDSPTDCFYLLEGMLQLIDESQNRYETLTPVDGGESLPLPFMLPAMQNCRSLVDSTVLCVNRVILAEVLEAECGAVENTSADKGDPNVWNDSQADVVKEFLRARQEQQLRLEAQGIVVQNDPAVSTLANSLPKEECDSNSAIEVPLDIAGGTSQAPQIEQTRQSKLHLTAPTVGLESLDVPKEFRAKVTKKREIQSSAHQSDTPNETQAEPISLKAAFKVFGSADGLTDVPRSILMQCFLRCEAVEYRTGDRIIKQGSKGDHWYLIVSGGCDVRFSHLNRSIELNHYGPGGSFGEDSLISGKARNAHVYASADSTMLRLKRDDFCRFLMPYISRSISFEAAKKDAFKEAVWIDVRMPQDKAEFGLVGGVEIPFPVIRAQFYVGDIKRKVIVVCRDGSDSPVIAYMLRRQGFDASYLDKGFEAIPQAQLEPRNSKKMESGVIRRQ